MALRESPFLPHPWGLHGLPSSARALTLVEIMVAMTLLATVMAGFLAAFVQSRRISESSVMHAAASSLIYGLVEQMKGLDYNTLLPSAVADAQAPASSSPPYIRVRLNQDEVVWLQTVHTAADDPDGPQAPTTTPAATATAASLGAIDNVVGPLPLSSIGGASSQPLTMRIWVWVDEIPDADNDVSEVKKVTLVYAYDYLDGRTTRTAIDREVFLRTRFDQ